VIAPDRDSRADPAWCEIDHDQHCTTCGDLAESMTVLSVDDERALALCAGSDQGPWTVEIALVAPVAVGDSLLVHAGTAIARDAGGETERGGT
jgi:hypothetical protein